jgi:hypothetical protein
MKLRYERRSELIRSAGPMRPLRRISKALLKWGNWLT